MDSLLWIESPPPQRKARCSRETWLRRIFAGLPALFVLVVLLSG
jgi:hypothetical protein